MDHWLLQIVEMLKKRLGAEAIERDWLEEYTSSYFKIPSPLLIIPEGCVSIGRSIFWRCKSVKEEIRY